MWKSITLCLIIILSIPFAVSYRYVNQSGYTLDVDFASGGVQNRSGDYNTSSIIGESLTPFNASAGPYNINQGLYYIILSNVVLGLPSALLAFSISIEDFGIEWVTLEWI